MVEASPEKQRGREHGYDIDDWQRAEAEIVGKKQQPADVQAAPAEHPAMAVTMAASPSRDSQMLPTRA
jgi:hypothetical protein